ncbi:MAG: hypothetical protein AB8D78_06300 [Akkermansiaceae bacterium]
MNPKKLILLFLALFFLGIARGEKVPERREDASHVVVGKVSEVFKSDGQEYVAYVVKIQVEKVEKGKGPAKGHFFYAECFERKPHEGPGVPEPGASGHTGVPKAGERIRVFTNNGNSANEGVYPDWYDVLSKVENE